MGVKFGMEEGTFGHVTLMYTVSQKRCHPNHGYNFVNSWWICKILKLWKNVVNQSRIDKVIAMVRVAAFSDSTVYKSKISEN